MGCCRGKPDPKKKGEGDLSPVLNDLSQTKRDKAGQEISRGLSQKESRAFKAKLFQNREDPDRMSLMGRVRAQPQAEGRGRIS